MFIMADGAENALLAADVPWWFAEVGVVAVDGLVGVGVFGAAPGVSDRSAGDKDAGVVVFCDLLPFFTVSFLAGVAGGVGGGSAGSSDASLPFRFLPCRRHGSNGVARTRTSQGNLLRKNTFIKLIKLNKILFYL